MRNQDSNTDSEMKDEEMNDETAMGRTTLELDKLLESGGLEMVDEFLIAYQTLLDREVLESKIAEAITVIGPAELVETLETIDEERLENLEKWKKELWLLRSLLRATKPSVLKSLWRLESSSVGMNPQMEKGWSKSKSL